MVRPRDQIVKHGLIAGLKAAAAMILVMIALRFLFGVPSLTEIAADWFSAFLPGRAVDFLLETLSFSAKPLMFVGLLILQIMIGSLSGVAYIGLVQLRELENLGRGLWAVAFGVGLWLVAMMAAVPVFGGGYFGADVGRGGTTFAMVALISFTTYGAVLGYLSHSEVVDGSGYVEERRVFLSKMASWGLFGVLALLGVNFVVRPIFSRLVSGRFSGAGTATLSTEITPNEDFYVISKNIIDPSVNANEWRLEIGGLVEKPYSLNLDELRTMPSVEQFVTLECISNPVGGDLISNAKWRGVPLWDILEKAVVQPGVVDILFRAHDDYTESISLDKSMLEQVIVAYEMNGQPLPDEHGFPARLIVPGFFGIKQVKWMTAIEPVSIDYLGFWERRGWTDKPYVKTFSRFDIPWHRSKLFDDSVLVGGVAFAGKRGIRDVEISDDGGEGWVSVDYISEPLSAYTWVIWTMEYTPAKRGPVTLRVRATDGDGDVQTAEFRDTIPDGASGHDDITVLFEDIPA
ncbi:MAG: molybdopterin-dependent oxidoreductase [Chloroflexi bacterium]|nr:molybdopterin-dependent oxidoreductase [Chloroflexota bacterium]